jgi:hypothetical protein
MTMTPSFRKVALTAHVTASVGWLGALAVFLAHAVASVTSQDTVIVRAACIAMGLTAWFVIFPLSITSLITGLIQALGTAWGVFRHYWVLAKLLLTVLATTVLLLKLAPIGYLADSAVQTTFSRGDLVGLRVSILVHAVGGLLILLTVATLAIYKPAGMTPFGVRKHRERGDPQVGSDFEAANSTPLWVKVSLPLAILLVVVIGFMVIVGGHGPGAHFH